MIRPHENLGVLFIEFLELYGKNFNYELVGISIAEKRYYSKEERGRLNEQKPHLLSIQDPQNPENDIAKASFSIISVRQSFEHAFNVIVAAMGEIERWHRSGGATNQSRRVPSVLGSVIRVSDKTLRHRYYIEKTTNC